MTREGLAAELIAAYNEGGYLGLGEEGVVYRTLTDPYFTQELLETAAESLTCQPA
jgi:hypothetical protein